MDVSTPRGTGGLSPPPAVRSTADSSAGLARPPVVPPPVPASLPAGVRTADAHRTAENEAASAPGGEAPGSVRGRQPEPSIGFSKHHLFTAYL
eukprot:4264990-Amphidinium_carterae.1